MEAVLLAVIMLAVAWLVAWHCTDGLNRLRIWWPFDFREADPVAKQPEKRQRHNMVLRNPKTSARPWRRSGS